MCLAGHTVTILDEMRTNSLQSCWLHVDSLTICLFLFHVIFIHIPSFTFTVPICINCKPGSHPIVRSSPNQISGGRLLSPKPTLFSFPFLSFLLPFWHMLGEVPEKSHTFQFGCSQNRITAGGTTEIHWVMWHVTLTHCTTTQGTQGS